jgi:hypothetical protein
MTDSVQTADVRQDGDVLHRLRRDLRRAMVTLSPQEVRYLVDAYYTMQKQRIRAGNQATAMRKVGEPNEAVTWYMEESERLEEEVYGVLRAYAQGHPVGQWSLSIVGIGPVISAGLLAHIDIERAPTVGHIWRFAGLDPTVTWERGAKRPFNRRLKVICWHIGESFKRTSGHARSFYGPLYRARKALEEQRNAEGLYAEQAARTLRERPTHAQRDIYAEGRLPQGRLDLRATRWVTKLFLAHWHHVAYVVRYGTAPPKPYVISVMGHGDYIAPPNWPMPE